MRDRDRTPAGLSALVDVPERDTDHWYVVVSVEGMTTSRVVPIGDGSEVVVGRLPDCEVAIEHDAISRRHARIRRDGTTVIVEDLGSRNGTLINGAPITGTAKLAPGDRLTIGPATAIVAITTAMRRRAPVGSLSDLEDRLAAEVDRALRYQRQLALVMVRLEGGPDAVAMHVDRVAGELRRMDFVAEYGPDEIAIVLPEADTASADAVARRAAEGDRVKVVTAIASFPADGSSAGELLGAARATLRAARAPGRASTEKVAVEGRPIVVADPVMKQVLQLARQCAASNVTVLVVGETGVGKEVVAEAVHRYSTRAERSYMRINCASLPEPLLEAELFGVEKGALPGATRGKPGSFESAQGGSLFLDDIGEMPLAAQGKLLRAIVERRVVRVGGTREIAVDVRLICATNRDLEAEVGRGRFRDDLYRRLGSFVIPVPPLRDRRAEIEPLARSFARDVASDFGQRAPVIAPTTYALLAAYDWPGNVRELKNAIERAVVLAAGGPVEPEHLPDRIRDQVPRAADGPLDVRRKVAEVERDAVIAALEAASGNQTHAAKRLGVSRFALIRLLEKHGLRKRGR